jgi:hypothetical protein
MGMLIAAFGCFAVILALAFAPVPRVAVAVREPVTDERA